MLFLHLSVSNIIENSLRERTTSFERISYRWVNRQITPESEWRADVMHYINDQPGLYPDNGTQLDNLTLRADEALYQAKKWGVIRW